MKAKKHRFAHVCLLVKDIEKAICDYTAILGVVDPKQLQKQMVRYDDFGVGDERLIFVTFPAPGDACEIQFMQPLTPGTPLYERLQKHGEGVHHICFTSSDLDEIVSDLRKNGIPLTSDPVADPGTMPFQKWTFVSPQYSHGVLIELAKSYDAIDGKWYQAKE